MSIFARVSDIFKANVNEMLDRMEDPEKMVKQMIIEMEEALVKATSGLAKAMANEQSLNKQQALAMTHSGVRTLGFKYREKIIPLGRPLCVAREVRQSAGNLRIGRPSEKGKPFIVSVKSEEEVTAGVEGKAKTQFYIGIALVVIGLAVALFVK